MRNHRGNGNLRDGLGGNLRGGRFGLQGNFITRSDARGGVRYRRLGQDFGLSPGFRRVFAASNFEGGHRRGVSDGNLDQRRRDLWAAQQLLSLRAEEQETHSDKCGGGG
ncbi:MAG TPA: hypothetical protein EYP31_07410 [Roseibacterium sp.]|nr:hypothetical protein [Roseibacterium sp.]